jgi:hypothetical protein
LRGSQGFCGDPAGGRSLGGVVLLSNSKNMKTPITLKEAMEEIKRLNLECDRLANRNTLLMVEIEERNKAVVKRLKYAIVRALYEGEG